MGSEYRRHVTLYKILRVPVSLVVRLKFKFRALPMPEIPPPYLVLSNHTTNWDPIFLSSTFKEHMYFVASEHVYRRGIPSAMLKWGIAPISKMKGATDSASAFGIIRKLKQGANVCLFVEGDRTWNGVTLPIHPTAGRLVKRMNATLVTYRLTGGYLTSPRWSSFSRRGKLLGQCIQVYSKEALSAMTPEEVTEAIQRDLHEDAFETQRKNPAEYRGKRLAEKLEMALYVCPSCKGLCTMHSEDNRFLCTCGMMVTYNEYGFFEGDDRSFDTVLEWDAWQQSYLEKVIHSWGEQPFFSDGDQSLWRIDENHMEHEVSEGALSLYKDRLVLGNAEFMLGQISQMSLYGRETIVFSADGIHYEIKSPPGRNGRKYKTMYDIIAGLVKRNSR